MKNLVNHLTRIALLTAIVVGLVAGSGAVPAFAKKKAGSDQATTATTESGSTAEGEQAKPEASHHRKHHKHHKAAAGSTESTTPKQ